MNLLWNRCAVSGATVSVACESSLKHKDIKRNTKVQFNLQMRALLQDVTAHTWVKGSNIFCSIKICQNFIFVNFLFQPWLVLSFPRCKAEAALLLSRFPFFLFFFHFSFTAQNYLLWWTTKKKKIALQALFWGKARPRKKKRNIFYGWDKIEVCIFYLFHISDTTPSTPKTLWMKNQPRASVNNSWQNGTRNAKSFSKDRKPS